MSRGWSDWKIVYNSHEGMEICTAGELFLNFMLLLSTVKPLNVVDFVPKSVPADLI